MQIIPYIVAVAIFVACIELHHWYWKRKFRKEIKWRRECKTNEEMSSQLAAWKREGWRVPGIPDERPVGPVIRGIGNIGDEYAENVSEEYAAMKRQRMENQN